MAVVVPAAPAAPAAPVLPVSPLLPFTPSLPLGTVGAVEHRSDRQRQPRPSPCHARRLLALLAPVLTLVASVTSLTLNSLRALWAAVSNRTLRTPSGQPFSGTDRTLDALLTSGTDRGQWNPAHPLMPWMPCGPGTPPVKQRITRNICDGDLTVDDPLDGLVRRWPEHRRHTVGTVDELLDPRLLTVAGCELQIRAADENPVEASDPILAGMKSDPVDESR